MQSVSRIEKYSHTPALAYLRIFYLHPQICKYFYFLFNLSNLKVGFFLTRKVQPELHKPEMSQVSFRNGAAV